MYFWCIFGLNFEDERAKSSGNCDNYLPKYWADLYVCKGTGPKFQLEDDPRYLITKAKLQ